MAKNKIENIIILAGVGLAVLLSRAKATPPTPTPSKWKCSGDPNYTCVTDPSGTYDSQAECQLVCQVPLPLPSIELTPPSTIKVKITATGQIVTLDFKTYLKNVLPNEIYPSWNPESLQSFAIAAKTYAWYWIINHKYPGQDYDVVDTISDQVYVANTQNVLTDQAVDATWNIVMTKSGAIFEAQYDSGTEGTTVPLTPGRLSQWGTQLLAMQGDNWQQILQFYYPDILLSMSTPPLHTFNVGITVFGDCPESDNAIAEFKTFVETNCALRLNLIVNHYGALSDQEQYKGGDTTVTPQTCGFPTWWTMDPANISRIPVSDQTNIIIYRNTVPTCLGGGTWGGDVGFDSVPWVTIPYVQEWTHESGWTYKPSGTLVHEFTNALGTILQNHFPYKSAEECPNWGFTGENDPGWVNCRKKVFQSLTPEMIEYLYNYVSGV